MPPATFKADGARDTLSTRSAPIVAPWPAVDRPAIARGSDMRNVLIIAALGVALAGCNAASRTDRTIAGGGIGAATGAAIGGLATGTWGGALAGAAIGGVGGAIIGNATTPRACWARDAYGRRIRVACP